MEDKKTSQLKHKVMNLYQIEMMHLKQRSQLITATLPFTDNLADYQTRFFVKDENVLGRLQNFLPTQKVGILDLADPRQIGSLTVSGQVQEKFLCRNSYLYPELNKYRRSYYYKNTCQQNNGYFSSEMIYAKDIKFLRDAKEDHVLTRPRYADVAVIAAPNVELITQLSGQTPTKAVLEKVLRERIIQLLRAFKQAQVTCLILGAFGCERAQNDPAQVARIFKQRLLSLEFKNSFAEVYFDILNNKYALQAFEREFNEIQPEIS